jgi:hypothetical protein
MSAPTGFELFANWKRVYQHLDWTEIRLFMVSQNLFQSFRKTLGRFMSG